VEVDLRSEGMDSRDFLTAMKNAGYLSQSFKGRAGSPGAYPRTHIRPFSIYLWGIAEDSEICAFANSG
ncbi:MAG: hypothetical protein O2967_22200, partial [Proteobacteria bacterium]|nr:hypothetical protein [Pseudomonadota bacterium]